MNFMEIMGTRVVDKVLGYNSTGYLGTSHIKSYSYIAAMDRPRAVKHQLPSTLVSCLLVGLWTFSVIAEATPENLVFRQRAEVSTTQSTWVLGFTIDLGSYGRFLAQVRDNLNLSDWLIVSE